MRNTYHLVINIPHNEKSVNLIIFIIKKFSQCEEGVRFPVESLAVVLFEQERESLRIEEQYRDELCSQTAKVVLSGALTLKQWK